MGRDVDFFAIIAILAVLLIVLPLLFVAVLLRGIRAAMQRLEQTLEDEPWNDGRYGAPKGKDQNDYRNYE